MDQRLRELLEKESYTLLELCDKIEHAVDKIIQTGLKNIREDNTAVVSEDILCDFDIDPCHDDLVMDAISGRLSERPEVFSFDTTNDGYEIEFILPEEREALDRCKMLNDFCTTLMETVDSLIAAQSASAENNGAYLTWKELSDIVQFSLKDGDALSELLVGVLRGRKELADVITDSQGIGLEFSSDLSPGYSQSCQ